MNFLRFRNAGVKDKTFVQHSGAPTETAKAGDEHISTSHTEESLSRIIIHNDVNLWNDLITSEAKSISFIWMTKILKEKNWKRLHLELIHI